MHFLLCVFVYPEKKIPFIFTGLWTGASLNWTGQSWWLRLFRENSNDACESLFLCVSVSLYQTHSDLAVQTKIIWAQVVCENDVHPSYLTSEGMLVLLNKNSPRCQEAWLMFTLAGASSLESRLLYSHPTVFLGLFLVPLTDPTCNSHFLCTFQFEVSEITWNCTARMVPS